MNILTKTIFMLCLILSASSTHSYARVKTENEKEKGAPVIIIRKTQHVGPDKSNSIQASINGHWLSVVFLENLGQVAVEVSSTEGGDVVTTSINTPNGMNINISDTGSYIVTFTLENGDEYYGEFEVTD